MKTVSKKLLSLLLVVMLLVSAVPFQAFASDYYTLSYLVYLNGKLINTYTVTDLNKSDPNEEMTWETHPDYDTLMADSDFAGAAGHISSMKNGSTKVDPDAPYCVKGNAKFTVNVKLDESETETAYNLILHTYNGNFDDVQDGVVKYHYGDAMSVPPTPKGPSGYTFMGWSSVPCNPDDTVIDQDFVDANKVLFNNLYSQKADMDVYAMWMKKTGTLTVYAVAGSTVTKIDLSDSYLPILGQGENVLDYLHTNVDALVENELDSFDGCSWNGVYYTNKGCSTELKQSATAGASTTVYVKFASNSYTVKLDANGGSVTPTSKTVKYGEYLTLPIPTMKNKVFYGWEDVDGNIHTPGADGKVKFIYTIPGNSTMTAVWEDQARVLLKMFANGNTDPATATIVDVTKKVKNDTFSLSEAKDLAKTKFKAKSGTSLSYIGLFTEAGWDDYVDHDNANGATDVIVIDDDTVTTEIYMMVKNAKSTTTTIDGSGSSSGSGSSGSGSSSNKWDSSNPKTGDYAMLGTAAAIMVLAAAALVIMPTLRKKKEI